MRLADGMMMVGKTENFPIYMIFGAPLTDIHMKYYLINFSVYQTKSVYKDTVSF